MFGLAKNDRLNAKLSADLAAAAKESQETGKSARRFKDFAYRTRDSWSRERRVVGKAEWMTPTQAAAGDMAQREKKKKKGKKKEPGDRRRNRACPPSGKPSSISSHGRRPGDVPTVNPVLRISPMLDCQSSAKRETLLAK